MNDLQKSTHERVDQLEQAMLSGGVIVPEKVTHHFFPGLYLRDLELPGGTLNVSRIHKTEHPYVLLAGKVSVYNAETGGVEHLEAPHFGVTMPGARRVVYAHSDMRWVTIHPNPDNKRDPDELASRFVDDRDFGGKTTRECYLAAVAALKELSP